MRPQIIHAILLAAAVFLAFDDAYLMSVGQPTAVPFFFPAIIAALPIAWMINCRRESLKRLGQKLFTPGWVGLFTVTGYFFLLNDMAGASMMHDRISPLPRYVLPAILAVLPAIYAVSYLRKSFTTAKA